MSNSCSIAHFAQRRMRSFQALPQGRGKIPSYFVKFLRFSSLNLQKFASSERYFAHGCCRFFKLYGDLDSGDIDFSINIKSTLKLSRQHLPVAPPYSKLQLVLYSHLHRSNAPRDDTVAAIRAFDYQGQRQLLLQRGYIFIDLPDSVSASQFFLHQRSQHLLTYDGPFRAYLQAQQPELLKTLQRKSIDSIDTFYILSAKSPHQTAMQRAITAFASKHRCIYLTSCQQR